MKKFVLFVAMFAVFTSALTACGSKKTEEAPVAEVVEEGVAPDLNVTPEESK